MLFDYGEPMKIKLEVEVEIISTTEEKLKRDVVRAMALNYVSGALSDRTKLREGNWLTHNAFGKAIAQIKIEGHQVVKAG